MAPSFNLRGFSSPSPSKASLSLVLPPASAPKSSSPLASPLSPAARSLAPSPALSQASAQSYFDGATFPAISRPDALKTVKVLENLLAAWNEYRQAITTLSKASRKFGSAIKDVTGQLDKTEVSSQTLRPVADVLDGCSEITSKLAKRVDKEYAEANADASKYFTLLAKETRSQDAYVASMIKRHEKAEKAFRKASKSMSEASTAHVGLQSLRDSIGEDMARANSHQSALIGSKQAMVILRLASSAGVLASSLVSFFSESLKKVGSASKDIEYFRTLAEIAWQGALPADLDQGEAEEEARREELRVMKTRVAMGELERVDPEYWTRVAGRPGTLKKPRPVSVASIAAPLVADQSSTRIPVAEAAVSQPSEREHLVSIEDVQKRQQSTAQVTTSPMSSSAQTESYRSDAAHATSPSDDNGEARDRLQQSPRQVRGSRPAPPATPQRYESHESVASSLRSAPQQYDHRSPPPATRRHDSQGSELSSHSSRNSVQARAIRFEGQDEVMAPQRKTHSAQRSSVSIPGLSRSVSQIAADLQARGETERVAAFEEHRSHTRGFVRDCHLCSMDYDRLLKVQHPPPDLRTLRRQTLPPAYLSSPPQQMQMPPTPRTRTGDARFPGHVPDFSPHFTPTSASASYSGIASPRPRRGMERFEGFD